MSMQVPKRMRAARLHQGSGSPVVDEVEVPEIDDDEVLIRVKACGIVPNLLNVVQRWPAVFPDLPLPPFPAILGLDPAGEIAQIGQRVKGVKVGDRVYVNPIRACNTCRHCADGNHVACTHYTFAGYFGFSPKSREIYKRYPSGGFAEYMRAPCYALAKIPESMSFEEAARFGYVGTAYGALRRAAVGSESTVMINGASGTLGLGAVVSALALGARRVLGVARNRRLLEQVKALAPDRIEIRSVDEGPMDGWVHEMTDGEGVDVALDCLPFGASPELFLSAVKLVRRDGVLINAGGVVGDVPLPLGELMIKGITVRSSNWFTPKHAREMSALVASGNLDLSVLTHETYSLDQLEEALSSVDTRRGGFTNIVIRPHE